MTDLNLAYGYNDEETYIQKPKEEQQKQLSPPPQQLQQPPPQQPQILQSQQLMNTTQQDYKKIQTSSYSFWERMVSTKTDVIKLAVFALVILLGISMDRIGTYYISKYLTENSFSYIQELIIRISYPIFIFILLWIIKSL
jgi:membrane glycosyltransferase